MNFISNIITAIGNAYPTASDIYSLVGLIIACMVVHRGVYIILGMFFTRKFKPAQNQHKYAVVIAARNEEAVIGNLLDSIKKQDYPQELLTVFVVADNCTDKTAEIVRSRGAICYERFDENHKTKGFALQYLFECIQRDYGTKSFEGYFVFDADNLLKEDYISRMNDSFDAGEKIITSYRNTKNFNESWVASTYALHWLRSIRFDHRARSLLRLATNIQGTGFLFSNEIVEKGWKYTSLTEDRALTADAVAQGYRISYNDSAEFYDEQPVNLKVALRQRLRWSKGHLLAFVEIGPYLLANIFFGKLFIKTRFTDEKKQAEKSTSKSFWSNVLESIRHRFASFDILTHSTPVSAITLAGWLIVPFFMYACYCYTGGVEGVQLFAGSTLLANLLRFLFPFEITLTSGVQAFFVGVLIQIWLRILYRLGSYIESTVIAIYLFIAERKRMIKIPLHKKILYVLTWPVFDIIGRYTTYVALFVKVTWKPIPHKSKITIEDIQNSK